jgi:hypothetical protein
VRLIEKKDFIELVELEVLSHEVITGKDVDAVILSDKEWDLLPDWAKGLKHVIHYFKSGTREYKVSLIKEGHWLYENRA